MDYSGRNLLHSAARSSHSDGAALLTIKLLLRDETFSRLIPSVDNNGQNALHYAVSGNWPNIDIIKHLLDVGIDIDKIDNKGCNPLSSYITLAPITLQEEVIRILAENAAT